mmetsp:Transcript_137284/g.382945  ORF Transcript_137284/g.382945 Transcript_137284/m.382945 type:complete len:260 (+) Transcript_137284:2021-2800(+)
MSLSSPTSYLTASRSCTKLSMPGASPPPPPPPRGWDPRNAILFSMSVDMTCNWLETCASKSVIRFVIFFSSWASPALPPNRGLPVAGSSASPPPVASSESTRDSSFLNRSLRLASVASERFLSSDCNSRDSVLTTSEAYFFTSAKTCDKSAVDASRRVANIESESFRTVRNCSHSAPTSLRFNLPQALLSRARTDSICLWLACMVSIRRFWLASMAIDVLAGALRSSSSRNPSATKAYRRNTANQSPKPQLWPEDYVAA